MGATTFEFAPVPHLRQPFVVTNSLSGTTHGGDLTVRWQPVSTLLIEGSVTAVRTSLKERTPANPPDQFMVGLEGSTPKQEYKLRLQWDPLPRWSIDLALRHFDRLPSPMLPSYTGVDARLAWRPHDDWEIDLIGRELLDPMHGELSKNIIGAEVRETARSFFLRATYRH
jgi:iron complex outermembrane receptor protein